MVWTLAQAYQNYGYTPLLPTGPNELRLKNLNGRNYALNMMLVR